MGLKIKAPSAATDHLTIQQRHFQQRPPPQSDLPQHLALLMVSFNLILVCLFSTANLGARAEKPDLPPTTLQLDLVYPRPNELHRRTYPFPIIFAIHGARNLWPYHLYLRWFLRNEQNRTPPGAVDNGAFDRMDIWSPTSYTKGDYPSGDEDPFYYVASTLLIGDSNSTEYSLRWSLQLPTNCTDGDSWAPRSDMDPPDFSGNWIPGIDGGVVFQVSNDGSLNLERESCVPVNETFIKDVNSLRVGGTVSPTECIFFNEDNFRPDPKPCAAPVDSALASRVSDAMVRAADCEGRVWPDEIPDKCDYESRLGHDDEDGAGRLGGGHFLAVCLSLGLGALFVMG